jgi:hypothetical protein
MNDNTREPFRCPAQECHDDEQGSAFGDAKRFHLHWFATHKPRCPRTDCKYSLQDLSKTTKSYFLRHWATHFPDLRPDQSACAKCGRQFANANNRDRHAVKCVSGTSGDDPIVAEVTGHGYDMDATWNAFGDNATEIDFPNWSGLIGDQMFPDTLHFDAEHAFFNDFAVPSVCMAEASGMITVAPPISTSYVAVSTVDPYFDYTVIEQTSSFSLLHDPFSLPMQGPRAIELEDEPADNFSGAKLDHMFDPEFLDMLEVTTGANEIVSSSRKRLCENETSQRKRRHHTVVIDADHPDASFNFTDTHPGAEKPEELWLLGGMTKFQVQDGSSPLEPTTPVQHQSTSASFQDTDDHDIRSLTARFAELSLSESASSMLWDTELARSANCSHCGSAGPGSLERLKRAFRQRVAINKNRTTTISGIGSLFVDTEGPRILPPRFSSLRFWSLKRRGFREYVIPNPPCRCTYHHR